jgi:hypothetical protein
MSTAPTFITMLLFLLLQVSPVAAYSKAYAPFAPGKEPARVSLGACMLVRDDNAPVGDYACPFTFRGTITKATVELADK